MKHLTGAPFYGRQDALPTNIRLGWKRNVGDKHSSLLRKSVNYICKTLYSTGPRWQHGSQICFATFIQQKIIKWLKTQQPLKLYKTYTQIWNPQNFGNCLMRVWLNLKSIKVYLINLATDFYGNQAIYWVKDPNDNIRCMKGYNSF